MFLTYPQLRTHLAVVLENKAQQGHDTSGLSDRLAHLPDSYDALHSFSLELSDLPMRPDWTYVEPSDWAGILEGCDPTRPLEPLAVLSPAEESSRIEAAFLGSVCGCILGKPIEINPTLEEIRAALEPLGEWPLRDYLTRQAAFAFERGPHHDWVETVRENLRFVAPDDDLNYTLLGMMVLEQYGLNFTRQELLRLWMHYLPFGFTFGPERTVLTRASLNALTADWTEPDDDTLEGWVTNLNPDDEACGAMIRADAYGYACPGNPALAAQLAWRDASLTHRRTGMYGTMFAAAAISSAFVCRDPLEIFSTALKFVPQKSRFYRIVSDSLNEVAAAGDWLEGYARIHSRYGEYSHCQVYQESGTLINTLRFAQSVGDGICKQVMQGNDTDSYGATAGSILGAYFGPGHLEDRWIAPFDDRLQTKLAGFSEHRLGAVAARLGQLPGRLRERTGSNETR